MDDDEILVQAWSAIYLDAARVIIFSERSKGGIRAKRFWS